MANSPTPIERLGIIKVFELLQQRVNPPQLNIGEPGVAPDIGGNIGQGNLDREAQGLPPITTGQPMGKSVPQEAARRNPFLRILGAPFRRPVFEREVSELVSPERTALTPQQALGGVPPGELGFGGVPIGGRGIIPPPVPEERKRTIRVKGPIPALAFLADFLAGFGGPGAALPGIRIRQEGIERAFKGQEKEIQRRTLLAQKRFDDTLELKRQELATRGIDLREKEYGLDVAKFRLALNDANKILGFDIGNRNEIATVGVLFKRGIDIKDRDEVIEALSKPEVLKEIGDVTSLFGRDEQGVLSERLATLRGFDQAKNPRGYADEVIRIEHQLATAKKISLGEKVAPPPKSTRDQMAGFILKDVFSLDEPRKIPGSFRINPAAQRYQRLQINLSELIRKVGDEDSVRELLDAAKSALGTSATPEQIVDAIEAEIARATGKKSIRPR